MTLTLLHKTFSLMLVSLCACLAASAQRLMYNSYSLSEGIMSQTVYCAMQDSSGYVWFGTDAGVSRFDGNTFENFTTDDGLCDNEVLRIQQDSKGRIWFLSLSGCLAYYEGGKIISALNDKRLVAEIKTLGMTCMMEDLKGYTWFTGMDNHAVKYDNETAQVFLVDSTRFGNRRSNVYMYHRQNTDLVFQCSFYSLLYDGAGFSQLKQKRSERPLPNCFYSDGNNAYGLTMDGLLDFSSGTIDPDFDRASFPEVEKSIGLTVFDNDIWIPSGSLGVEHFQKIDGRWKRGTRLFTDEWINFVFEDADHNTWFCTRDHGVYCIVPQRSSQFFYELGEPYEATCFTPSGDGQLFLGTNAGDVYSISLDDNSIHLFHQHEQLQGIENMVCDAGDYLFVRTAVSAATYDFSSGKIIGKTIEGAHPKVISLAQDGKLYMAMLTGVYCMDFKNGGNELMRVSEIPAYRIYSLCAASDGRLWFENHDKLYYFLAGVVHEAQAFNNVSSGRISSIVEAGNGKVLVSTMGSGIYMLQGDQLVDSFSREKGLPSNECEWVNVIGEDAYVLTSDGLVQLKLQESSMKFHHHFTVKDGFPEARIYDVFANEEAIYLATHKGLFFFSRDSEKASPSPPEVHIQKLWHGGIEHTLNNVEFDYGENLKIDFTAIAFDMPEAVLFQYSFTSELESWTTTSNRSIEISSLEPGEHVFRLRAKKYNSDWSIPVELHIQVWPPIWARTWFRILVAIVLAGLVYLVFAYFARRKYIREFRRMEQEQVLLKERNRISTDLHDDIGAELSNIVILSRIARSKYQANDNPSDFITRIDHSASDVISKMNGIIWSLNPANDNLQNLVDYVRRYIHEFFEINNLNGKVTLEGIPDKTEVKALVRRNTFLIVKEALHNITKHSGATAIDVVIRIDVSAVSISISDNGKGFDPSITRPEGLGLGSMKKRADDMNALLEIHTVKDGGTRIRLQWSK